ncbi:MAG: hypothetical protein RL208_325 [Pseudomonadota bacterium]
MIVEIVEKMKSCCDSLLEKISNSFMAYEGSAIGFVKQKKDTVLKILAVITILIIFSVSYKYYQKACNARQMEVYITMMAEVNKEKDVAKKAEIIPNYIDKLKGNIKVMAALEAAFLYIENKNLDKAIEVLQSTLKSAYCIDRNLKNNLIIHTSSVLIEKADEKSIKEALKMLSKIRKKDRGFHQIALQKMVIANVILDEKEMAEKRLIDFRKTLKDKNYPSVFGEEDEKNLRYFIDNYKRNDSSINKLQQ